MAKFQFRERIPIDVPNTLMQLLARFAGVKDGLPELIKNAKDQYSRLGVTERNRRCIVVAINTRARAIGVIDFAGAPRDQFGAWERWSDPTANTRERAADIEGGHGNGGKAFMVLGSTSDAAFESCYEGRRTRMGYQNDSDKTRFKPGVAIEDSKPVDNQPVADVEAQLDEVLSELGLSVAQLPPAAREALAERQSYTIAQVNGVRDWSRAREETVRRLVAEIPSSVECHPQASLSLESCSVWFVVDGQVVGGAPAQARLPEPFPGFADPIQLPLPDELLDPRSGEMVETGPGGADTKVLILRTSAKSLRTEDYRLLRRCA